MTENTTSTALPEYTPAVYCVAGLALEDCMPAFDAMDLAGKLAHELNVNHQAMPESTKNMVMLVAASLFKLALDVGVSGQTAAELLMKLQAQNKRG